MNDRPFNDDTTNITGIPAVTPQNHRHPHGPPQGHPQPPTQGHPRPNRHRGTPPPYLRTPPPPRNGVGVAGLAVGIVALLTGLIPLFWLPAAGLAVLALALAFIGYGRTRRHEATNRKTAIAGIAVGALAFITAIIGASIFFSALNQLDRDLNELGAISETPPASVPSSAPFAPPAPAEAPAPEGLTEGTYLVGDQIQPGTYSTTGTNGLTCYWERLSGTSGEFDDLIANGVGEGPMVVTVSESDVAFSTSGCQPWTLR